MLGPLFHLTFYLFMLEAEQQRKRERGDGEKVRGLEKDQDLPFFSPLFKCFQQLGLNQDKVKSLELQTGILHG